jgi:predicted HicB family RNase H-like nuclease
VVWTLARAPEETLSVSESRKLTGKVLVRFTEEDLSALQQEADRQGVSLPHLMRELSLRTLLAQAS